MICENEVYIGGPPDSDRELCWGTAVTRCVDCKMRLCIGCVDTCYEKACDLCPGCRVDHQKRTGHAVEHFGEKLSATLSDGAIDQFAARVSEVVRKDRAS